MWPPAQAKTGPTAPCLGAVSYLIGEGAGKEALDCVLHTRAPSMTGRSTQRIATWSEEKTCSQQGFSLIKDIAKDSVEESCIKGTLYSRLTITALVIRTSGDRDVRLLCAIASPHMARTYAWKFQRKEVKPV